MKASQMYAPTLREVPAEAEVISHKLMLRAGMIRKAAGGLYTYLPLAWRVLKKIENIVREEMDAKGGQELLMPILQPAELWQESGRWGAYGDEMIRVTDRHGRPFCLGPTHEEMITALVRSEVRSYRQLPLMLYQIQNKYRDERRPRFGLMRGREFIMKDLYSFDKDEAGLDISYQKMYDAYENIFRRCGLKCRPVEADSGAIGGSGSHEFMVLAESGEAGVVYCDECNYAANEEKAELFPIEAQSEELGEVTLVHTPDTKTIALVANYLDIDVTKTVKAVAYNSEKGAILVFVRGDHEVNEIKVQNAMNCMEIEMASEAQITDFGSVAGFMGPIGLNRDNVTVIADSTVKNMVNAVYGANQLDHHYTNVNYGRDYTADIVTDVRLIQEGDPCPHCGAPVKAARGIEVGQVFKLHTKYSEALKATFLDENGKEKPMVMGCYGVGVSRTMAAAIEQNHDDNGIIWAASIAPYHAVIVPINSKNADQMALAEQLYDALGKAGVECVFDDRKERAGVKFKDADLIGYPLKITVGPKAFEEDQIEVKVRKTGETYYFTKENYIEEVCTLLSAL